MWAKLVPLRLNQIKSNPFICDSSSTVRYRYIITVYYTCKFVTGGSLRSRGSCEKDTHLLKFSVSTVNTFQCTTDVIPPFNSKYAYAMLKVYSVLLV